MRRENTTEVRSTRTHVDCSLHLTEVLCGVKQGRITFSVGHAVETCAPYATLRHYHTSTFSEID